MRFSDWSSDVCSSDLESPKSTRPVRDTPQTVTVITGETIEQQNLLTLRDMLSTVPGITFGEAEGGSPPADSHNLRGYSEGKIGRGYCRERGCQSEETSVVGASLKKNR